MRPALLENPRALVVPLLNVLLVLCSLGALGLFVLVAGWPLGPDAERQVRLATRAVLGVFVAQEIIRMWLQRHRLAYLKTRKIEAALVVLILAEVSLGPQVHAWIRTVLPDASPGSLTLFLLACSQLTLLALIAVRALRRNRLLAALRLSPGMLFILSFALVIACGTLMLKTPNATVHGIGWLDAFFTATSSVCVTGLGVIDVSSDLTRHGQWIILGLVQVGGLGMMTLTYFFAYFLTGGVSLRNRIALQNLLNEDSLGQIGTVLGVIVGFTLAVELAGAAAIHSLLAETGGLPSGEAVFFSLFHSVSAFCNAGVSILPGNLADPAMHGRTGVIAVIMALIVTGGIGFPVVKNFWQVFIAQLRRLAGLRVAIPPRLTTNSRVVLVTSGVLVVGGAALIYLTEFVFADGRPATNMSPWFTALFQSVATRSAGFNVTPTELLTPATSILMMALMFVGGSPSSTAGGIKTSTLAVAVLALRRVVLGRPEIEAFGRRIPNETADRALAVMLLALGFFVLIATTLCMLHPELPPLDLVFEAIGAVSTAGLARGVTGELGPAAKLVMIAGMFIGRVGVLMFLLSFIPRRERAGYRYPEATIVIT
ncbi:ATPase [Termitidicoccus mucosus]|uniref:ATPase n=1 Tax=Termitidicoccus mucosus TaxID=1184151 RepID=A0A178IEP7_9BACT|nr:ATPase [Opitutaceae bacterium TSB47]